MGTLQVIILRIIIMVLNVAPESTRRVPPKWINTLVVNLLVCYMDGPLYRKITAHVNPVILQLNGMQLFMIGIKIVSLNRPLILHLVIFVMV